MTLAHEPPPTLESAVAALHATLAPADAARLAALRQRLAPPDYETVVELLLHVEEAGYGRGVQDVDREWAQTLAHVPGLAPALRLLHGHVRQVGAPCDGPTGCTLEPAP